MFWFIEYYLCLLSVKVLYWYTLCSCSPFLCAEDQWHCSSSIHTSISLDIWFKTKHWAQEKKTCWLWRIYRFGFSCFLCDKDPWSHWAEPSTSTHTEVVVSVLGFHHDVNTYISLAKRQRMEGKGDGDQKPAFLAINRAFYIISLDEH